MLTFNHTNYLDRAIGSNGISEDALATRLQEVQPVYDQVQQAKQEGKLGFAKLPHQTEALYSVSEMADMIRREFQTLVVIGIGGSDLGTRAVHRALNHQFYNLLSTPRLFFLGDTTDPVAIQEVFDVLDLNTTAFMVISKSGNTVEQMSTLLYARQKLLDQFGEEGMRQRIFVLTDAEQGTLREMIKQEGYRNLAVPSDVGGRFSVLSNTALLPLAVAGVDIYKLLEGAAAMDVHDERLGPQENLPLLYAVLQHWSYWQGRRISVLMPYSYSLRETGFWFRQLWAESLGKKTDLEGKEVFVGPTPIAAVGPTDQHSQVQLYMEGPADKVFTFIRVEHSSINMTLPEAFPDIEGVNYLKGHTFREILLAEHESTARALAEAGRPSGHLCLDQLDAYHLGQLLYFFELAVTYAGSLFTINTFDQPGVELGKKYMYQILGRNGF